MITIANVILLLVAVSTGYQLASVVCAWLFARWRGSELAKPLPDDAILPPVTILKPLCGAVPETYDNLANTCALDYPRLQIVFGVADAADPAIAIVKRLRRDFPEVDIELVVSDRRIGTNAKVSNLENMLQRAKHDVLVIADADIRADASYLKRVVPYLDEPNAGLVTCAYRAAFGTTLAHKLEALFINTDFAPMVTVARKWERQSYAFGATICIKRSVLEEIGGFTAIADHLADDYQMGNIAVGRGYVSVLAPVVVETVLDLDRLREVFDHQLRWARTYRICRPGSYLASMVTHTTLWATVYLLATRFAGWEVFATAVGLRTVIGGMIASRVFGVQRIWRHVWLVPFKDLFISTIFVLAYLGDTVRWGGIEFEVARDGRMRPLPEEDAADVAAAGKPA
ncbi:MAG TPA: bacteriohopanetetrol glucosamine biosynthesis glycosyltransferase HpnI [Candidatus Binatia bacterium]|nr:bacteriohopanetetrol glucosamine biosynthesis glycosyltransferase HpnI [Candidatus Binatia bacterium]